MRRTGRLEPLLPGARPPETLPEGLLRQCPEDAVFAALDRLLQVGGGEDVVPAAGHHVFLAIRG
jgi:hypothetical protein